MSGFGIAGTNAHVVLEEEAPKQTVLPEEAQSPPLAFTASSFSAESQRIAGTCCPICRFARLWTSDIAVQDLCWTAAIRRTPLDHRAAFVAADRAALTEMLRTYADGGAASAEGTALAGDTPKVCFICPGQGAQWVGMARQLMAQAPEFLAALERCDQAARPLVGWSIVSSSIPSPGRQSTVWTG